MVGKTVGEALGLDKKEDGRIRDLVEKIALERKDKRSEYIKKLSEKGEFDLKSVLAGYYLATYQTERGLNINVIALVPNTTVDNDIAFYA
ncbi:hypothetical protein KAU51_02125 [Candidatus Parcubacteria bacterium]|nr:hypothetical protein [Candidatus Parcubacteria bacterium]